jgi:NADH:ubiquinone oxidoreductase subunit 5 (subunit L)/multisubunit Na+/H+ antiporter MnhA subunit
MGWEILGISSFLLIAFYRERYLPVKNAIKVFSLYRIGDVGIILAMWASHHLFHENITFIQLSNDQLVNTHLDSHSIIGFFISFVLVMAALVKSAQIPFSSWLPRAMEGPTPSSAIFYGSLSVHLGAFLLMRTFNFWEHQISIRVLIIIFGILSSVIATLIARVQSSVKSQIAYSSIAQIGLIFIEIALGLETLALIHIAGNAFLRTYQLLVSPSVVSYLIREQMYHFTPKKEEKYSIFTQKVYQAFYILSLKEFKLESFQNYILWKPLKKMGSLLQAFNLKTLFLVFVPVYIFGVAVYFFQTQIPAQILSYLPTSFAFIGFIMILKSFSERQSPFLSWLLIFLNHLWIVLAISFNEYVSGYELTLYLAGVFVAGIFGYIALLKLQKIEEIVNLNQYLGHVYEHPKFAFLFLLACLGMTGFPITTTFIGEDLLFSHIHSDQVFLAVFVSLSFIISGISAIRIYARLFLGPHIKSYHVRANPSS